MSGERVPLYVRLPSEQAATLDRVVAASGRRKQEVVSELLADRLVVGRASAIEKPPAPAHEVLTLEEAAALLRVPAAALAERLERGELPARRFGGEWRLARGALLEWLADGEQPPGP